MNSNYNDNVYYFHDITIDKNKVFKVFAYNEEDIANKLWSFLKQIPEYEDKLVSKTWLKDSLIVNSFSEKLWIDHVSKYFEDIPIIDIQPYNNDKKRLFIDMDGTLVEWKNIKIEATDYEDIKEIPEKIDEILRTPGYFKNLKAHQNVIDCINNLLENRELDIYILSCVLPDKGFSTPRNDKNDWLDKYLPNIDKSHRIFVPDGENKIDYVPFGISENDYLLDDYTKNLNDWSFKGKGIKFLNGVNANKGTWNGARINIEQSSYDLYNKLKNYILKDEFVRDYTPAKRKNDFTYKEFCNLKNSSEYVKEDIQKEIEIE